MSTTFTTTTEATPAQAILQSFQTSVSSSSSKLQIPRGDVKSCLSFYEPPANGASPFNHVEPQPEGTPQRNFGEDKQTVLIRDGRGKEANFKLEQNAFQFIQAVPFDSALVSDFTNDEQIQKYYYADVTRRILQHVPGAKRVLVFDHTIRRDIPGASRGPVARVHVDQTPRSGALRVRIHLPDEAEALLKDRVRIINLWRPIHGPVYGPPLAVANAQTVGAADLVPVRHIYPQRDGETAAVRHTGEQQWWYWSGMMDDEVILLQCYDSEERGNEGVKRAPHTAFTHPGTERGSPPRESIEVRCLVFG